MERKKIGRRKPTRYKTNSYFKVELIFRELEYIGKITMEVKNELGICVMKRYIN